MDELRKSGQVLRLWNGKGDIIYATLLGRPENEGDVFLKSFAQNEWATARGIKNLSLLGSGQKVEYDYNEEGLKIKLRDGSVDDMAVVFKIELE